MRQHHTDVREAWPGWLDDLPIRGAYVYDLYDDNPWFAAVPAYVGCSENVRARAKSHLTSGRDVLWVLVHGPFPSREMAERFERDRIAELQPKWNVEGVTTPWRAWFGARR